MNGNPFEPQAYINDPDDFSLPYKYSGRDDTEVMFRKYQNLQKTSYGYIVRLGIRNDK